MDRSALLWGACLLSAGIWLMVGFYKIMHVEKMVGVVRAHSIPFPVLAFWLSVAAELGGGVILLFTPQIWIACAVWILFMLVATPIFHGHAFSGKAIDYPQYVQIGKNLSIAGGLIALMLNDENFIRLIAGWSAP
jgi:putative oxidoreductase